MGNDTTVQHKSQDLTSIKGPPPPPRGGGWGPMADAVPDSQVEFWLLGLCGGLSFALSSLLFWFLWRDSCLDLLINHLYYSPYLFTPKS